MHFKAQRRATAAKGVRCSLELSKNGAAGEKKGSSSSSSRLADCHSVVEKPDDAARIRLAAVSADVQRLNAWEQVERGMPRFKAERQVDKEMSEHVFEDVEKAIADERRVVKEKTR